MAQPLIPLFFHPRPTYRHSAVWEHVSVEAGRGEWAVAVAKVKVLAVDSGEVRLVCIDDGCFLLCRGRPGGGRRHKVRQRATQWARTNCLYVSTGCGKEGGVMVWGKRNVCVHVYEKQHTKGMHGVKQEATLVQPKDNVGA